MEKIEPINTTALQTFFKLVKSADTSQAKEIRMTITDAKKLSYNLSQMLLRHSSNLESLFQNQVQSTEEVISVNVDGGKGW